MTNPGFQSRLLFRRQRPLRRSPFIVSDKLRQIFILARALVQSPRRAMNMHGNEIPSRHRGYGIGLRRNIGMGAMKHRQGILPVQQLELRIGSGQMAM